MRVLGLSAFYHDSAAALVEGGRIAAAAGAELFLEADDPVSGPGLVLLRHRVGFNR